MLRGTFCALWVALLAILPLSANATARPALCLKSHPDNRMIGLYPLTADGTFALEFIHSVSRTPVVDTYRIDANRIVQTSEIFLAHGAGLPSMGDEVDATGWRHENGRFILDLDRPIGTMIVRIQPEYKNTLHLADESIPLASLGQSVLRITACEPPE
ncbi:DUF1850 domain-containing protein [Sulfitobacter sp. F26169L]|uniref:DUF1850 domain-containing protein n=1 Tax=Sulfitobacter sp. F26169L TaxID=2996015 RepID=UPI002260E73E|nr:DUF1850 domain-containing protein [Sulfitobacter sp. F26169L]MCX7568236.1 DUF1850 domain-containing protein [Sulfitobacter sp. F26169L]